MPPLSLWRGQNVKTNDYKLIDRLVSEQYRIGGTEFWVYKYLGPSTAGNANVTGQVVTGEDNSLVIQDALNMEIRDRKYDTDVYSLKGHYAVSDTEFDLRQFGLFLSNDTIFITFHMNNMVDIMGRRINSGDVIEILHQRDDLVTGLDYAVSKFYVVQEGTRPAEGYSPTWWPHIWRVKCQPMPDSQEFKDILGRAATDASGDPIKNPHTGKPITLNDLLSTYNAEIAVNDAILAEAEAEVPYRNLQGAHFYVLQDDIAKPASIWAGDGIPPNGSKPVNSGIIFPTDPVIGDYFLRTDYSPNFLFRREANKWVRVEINYRELWSPANRLLETFINNTTVTTLTDGTQQPEQQNLRKAVKPKLDPDIV